MTIHGSALFIHVVSAILLVGGFAFAHVTIALARGASTVDGIRSHAGWLQVVVKASGPIAAVVLAAGLYLTFAGQLWSAGWPVVALVLLAFTGAVTVGLIAPRVERLGAMLDNAVEGPVSPELRGLLAARPLHFTMWMLTGADLAIVFLMTNKPGWAGAVAVGATGLLFGATVGVWAGRRVPVASAPTAAG